jgi:dTDP-6-deoxy-L-talose 4-dehydrogenase (NAD+)
MSCTDAGVVNLCSGTPVTVLDLVRQWLDERQSNMVLDTGRYPYPAYEPFAFWGSRRKLDRLLGTTC